MTVDHTHRINQSANWPLHSMGGRATHCGNTLVKSGLVSRLQRFWWSRPTVSKRPMRWLTVKGNAFFARGIVSVRRSKISKQVMDGYCNREIGHWQATPRPIESATSAERSALRGRPDFWQAPHLIPSLVELSWQQEGDR
jgi:hypothetical protein